MDWKLFVSMFGTIFLAEMGDKTQLAAIAAVSKTGKMWTVFFASVSALAVVTLIGVLGGEALTKVIPAHYLEKGAGVAFIVIGVLIVLDIV